jgi:hypothetical protein
MESDTVLISFKARTIVANPKKYAFRLQIREGDQQPFQDFSPIIINHGASISNDSLSFLNIFLPSQYIQKPYVQLLWKYYNTEVGTGTRDQLAVDDIVIQSIKKTNVLRNNVNVTLGNPIKLISLDRIEGGSRILFKSQNSILLLPNFKVENGSYFETRMETCEN